LGYYSIVALLHTLVPTGLFTLQCLEYSKASTAGHPIVDLMGQPGDRSLLSNYVPDPSRPCRRYAQGWSMGLHMARHDALHSKTISFVNALIPCFMTRRYCTVQVLRCPKPVFRLCGTLASPASRPGASSRSISSWMEMWRCVVPPSAPIVVRSAIEHV